MTFIINSSLQFAIKEQYIPPLKSKINKPAIFKKEITILGFEEQIILEKYLQNNINGTSLAILLSLHAGLRIGEICALTWDDIDLAKKILHVRHTVIRINNQSIGSHIKTRLAIDSPKTKSSFRTIPITSNLCQYLKIISQHSDSKYVISSNENFTNPRTLEYRYHRILKECNISSINFHALRHTFASRCVAAGVDIKSLSEILGHGSVNITLNTYVHSSMEQKRTQLEKMYSLFN